MKKKIIFNRIKRITALGLIMVMAFCFVPAEMTVDAATSYQGQINEAQKKRDELAKKKKELEDKIKNLTTEKDNLAVYMEQLDMEYTALYEEYEATEAELEDVKEKLVATQEDLERYTALEAMQYETMKKRVQYMYENGKGSILEVFIGSGNITDIFNQAEYRQQITKYDNQLLMKYTETKENRQNTELVLVAQKEELNAVRELQQEQLASLESIASQKAEEFEKVMAQLDVDDTLMLEYGDEILAADADIAALKKKEAERLAAEEKARQEALKRAQSQSLDNARWPLDGPYRITSYFGNREIPIAGASSNHKAIDIGAPTGTSVYAAIAGTVVSAGYEQYSGNIVRIDHGNGVRTEYCHGSKLCCKVGDYVQRGQLIMKVGATGLATGPHLHFAIKINGTPVDPLKYVKQGKTD